jgi:uncharacterized protein (DUF1800 family)
VTTVVKTEVALVGHLMRRAGFGLPAYKLEELAEKSYDAVVDDLVDYEKFEPVELDLAERYHSEHADGEGWMPLLITYRMINSQRPLQEKTALMWHGVFATGTAKVTNGPLMKQHYEMLRDFALNNFSDILKRLSRDPAMLFWLDQQMNHGVAVNENWGRELLELFSLGVGNYTEDDVRDCARAYTGWTLDQVIPRYPFGQQGGSFVFREDDHDDGQKTFLGHTGDFNGDDIVNIIVDQPAAAQFIGREVHKYFVSDQPIQEEIDFIAKAYTDNNHEIREVLRALFKSDFFKNSRFNRIQSPIEFVVGTIKQTGEYEDPYEYGLYSLPRNAMLMGQQLLNPPTVEGWHTGREWIDSALLMERVNFAVERVGNAHTPGVRQMIDRIRVGRDWITQEQLLDAVLYEMGALELVSKSRKVILEELPGESDIQCDESNAVQFDATAVEVFQLIAAASDYQLN